MKIDIALSGCQMITRMAEDYRVQFGLYFWEEERIESQSDPVCVRLLGNIKTLQISVVWDQGWM